jgi:hypothetical protein
MRSFLNAFIVISAVLLFGCNRESYICEVQVTKPELSKHEEARINTAIETVAARFGFQLFLERGDLLLFRKDPNEPAPNNFQKLDGAIGIEVTIGYNKSNHGLLIHQGDVTQETAFTNALKSDLQTALKEILGEKGYEIRIGTRAKSMGA